MKTSFPKLLSCLAVFLLPLAGRAQVNSGSNGSDGAFNPTQSVTINMADHPDGIYQYTSVNVPLGVTVNFIPNGNNTPVVWLVQGDCVINGTVDVSGQNAEVAIGGAGGPGGWAGGSGGTNPTTGQGPGAGAVGGGDASFASLGNIQQVGAATIPPGIIYGNTFLLPLLGGSGGGGDGHSNGGYYDAGGGGGGAILIVASDMIQIEIDGALLAVGGSTSAFGGGGSGGAIRLVANQITGAGAIYAYGGNGWGTQAGSGRVRFDTFQNSFGGTIYGNYTQGFQPIIIPAAGQGIQLSIASVAGAAVSASPSGVLANPDVIISAQQTNPIPIVVNCSNIPLNTQITVQVQPANGTAVTAVGLNSAGTLTASTATIMVNMPRGGGIIYATAVTGITGNIASTGTAPDAKTPTLATAVKAKSPSFALTGLTASGERFVAMEIKATLGGKQSITYLTQSGKRYTAN